MNKGPTISMGRENNTLRDTSGFGGGLKYDSYTNGKCLLL